MRLSSRGVVIRTIPRIKGALDRSPATAIAVVAIVAAAGASCGPTQRSDNSQTAKARSPQGVIQGHVRVTGMPPENAAIRMRADPMCDKANGGKRVLQEAVVVGAD